MNFRNECILFFYDSSQMCHAKIDARRDVFVKDNTYYVNTFSREEKETEESFVVVIAYTQIDSGLDLPFMLT